MTMCMVPSRHGVLSLNCTCPAALSCTRSFDSAGRVMQRHSCSSVWRSSAAQRTAACRVAERSPHMGHQLSGGEQQMLAIGRALVTNPHLLILDEATEGLAPLVREEGWRCLAALCEAGQTTLVIDKHVERLIRPADHHTVLERGRVA
jgi:ABC-type branched-subunit amino acid transport system ATPase component